MKKSYRPWKSEDLDVPLYDFLNMYDLTETELRTEGGSGRLHGIGVRGPESDTWLKIIFTETAIKRWLKTDLPPAIAAKVTAVGGTAALKAWRADYFSRIVVDPDDPGTWTLPDGSQITDIKVRRSDVERLFPKRKPQ